MLTDGLFVVPIQPISMFVGFKSAKYSTTSSGRQSGRVPIDNPTTPGSLGTGSNFSLILQLVHVYL